MLLGMGLVVDEIWVDSGGAIVDFSFAISEGKTTIMLAGFAKKTKVVLFG
jgi:hypothetical protein